MFVARSTSGKLFMQADNESSTATPHAVPERWWHRLVRVLVHLSTAIVLIIGAFVGYDSAGQSEQMISFEPGYAQNAGYEIECTFVRELDRIDCGERHLTTTEFIDAYLRYKGDEPARPRFRPDSGNPPPKTVSELYRQVRLEAKDNNIVSAFLRPEMKYKSRRVHPSAEIAKGMGLAFLAALTWWLAGMGLYKLLLYIVDGHTRIVKA